jgi:hypothetical protein
MKRSVTVSILAALCAGLCAGSASAATARLSVPGQAPAQRTAQLRFTVGAGWALQHGLMANTPVLGTYAMTLHPDAQSSCTLGLRADGVAVVHDERPTLAHGVLRIPSGHSRLTVADQGRAGALRWYAGALGATPANTIGLTGDTTDLIAPAARGIAVLPMPAWAHAGARSVAVASVLLTTEVTAIAPAAGGVAPPTAAEQTACATQARKRFPALLRSTLRSFAAQRRAAS